MQRLKSGEYITFTSIGRDIQKPMGSSLAELAIPLTVIAVAFIGVSYLVTKYGKEPVK